MYGVHVCAETAVGAIWWMRVLGYSSEVMEKICEVSDVKAGICWILQEEIVRLARTRIDGKG